MAHPLTVAPREAEVPMAGVLLVDKPRGGSSARIARAVGRELERRVGHAGTLDPLATGLLVLLVGRATRLARFVLTAEKVYQVGIRLGAATTTYDAEGEPTFQAPVPPLSWETLAAACGELEGVREQTVPAYSAVKLGGQRLYRLARRGVEVTPPRRTVEVRTFRLLAYEPPVLRAEVVCSKGTYVRSLAHEIGEMLGTGAHVESLRRTRVGAFDVGRALEFDRVGHVPARAILSRWLLDPTEALCGMPTQDLKHELIERFARGGAIPIPGEVSRASMRVAVQDEDGELVGVGEVDARGETLRPVCVIAGAEASSS
jgi:tRNA pseudouridine55 synthase